MCTRPSSEPVHPPVGSSTRTLHFDLSYLGPAHEAGVYRLRAGRATHPLQRHTSETLRVTGFAAYEGVTAPTHFAEAVAADPQKIQLVQVFGPAAANGYPTLAALVVSTPGDSGHYSVADVATALVFMNPSVTTLTPESADVVKAHIGKSDALPGLKFAITLAGTTWNTPQPLVDMHGAPVLKRDGSQYCTYELDPGVLNSTAPVSGQSKTAIYSDRALQGVRWNLHPGVSTIDMSPAKSGALEVAARGARGARNTSGYSVNLSDGGPNFGVSVGINGVSDDFVLDLTVTNSYIRHTSVFVSFLKADGVTPMIVPDNIWTVLVKEATASIVLAWWAVGLKTPDLIPFLTSNDNTLKWCGNVSAENTFMGIPVSSSSGVFTFGLPTDQGPVGKIRLLVGSLGVTSGNDWDPTAAWLGLSMTALIDLAIPTVALVATVGIESNKVFDAIFKSPTFLLPTALSVFQVAKDLFTDSPDTGNDLKSALTSLADRLVSTVITTTEVAAALAAYFGSEELEEAVPIVGWGLKALAIEATVEQLAQTVGEVIGSPRVVEFDITVTMNARITLRPDASTGGEFPATATMVSITAQYSGNTSRSYSAPISDPKVASIVVEWDQIPVGGSVTFIVAMFSKEGWGVGKGQSTTIANHINAKDAQGHGILAVDISVQQQLYPLGPGTTYHHNQLLAYGTSGSGTGYHWQQTAQAPTDTAESLGTGPTGHVLQALNGLTLSDDLGVLGYAWEASGLNIPPVQDDTPATELYTMQNIGFKPLSGQGELWPQAGYMTAPAGYPKAPLLLYLRTASDTATSLAGPGTFFLDPTGDSTSGFHLRQVKPVTNPAVGMGDPSRQFNLATGTSWGRFAHLPTSLAIHSNGYVVAVNPDYDNLQILRLSASGVPDADAPWAYIPTGPGTGPGRLHGPALAAIQPDQTILVLEAGNQRIQAFSRGGHPVPAFAQSQSPYWIPLVPHAGAGTSVVYLSMSVDVAGYIYVLSQNGNGYDPTDFNLDIYTPTGAHLVYQQGLVAAGLAVDLWRNVYTLNFQRMSGPGGRTEPSISEYIPSTPHQA